jgi:hypothetical protein
LGEEDEVLRQKEREIAAVEEAVAVEVGSEAD